MILLVAFAVSGCSKAGTDGTTETAQTFKVTYSGNGSDGGLAPTDPNIYLQGGTVTVLGNTGTLYKTANGFAGWNTQTNGLGTDYAPGATFPLGSANITLYAKWNSTTYTVTYSGNTNTGGAAPTDSNNYLQGGTITVLVAGTLTKTGNGFAGWNTQANGLGTNYAAGATFAMGSANVTLYAKWGPTYTVTYNGNGSDGGAVPTDSNNYLQGATVNVFGNSGSLVKTGNLFAGWNTLANGTGTNYLGGATFAMGTSNVTLYAKWSLYTNRDWTAIASSSDGVKLAAAVQGGQIYTSTDSGVTWTARETTRLWVTIVSSSDGVKLAAVVHNGQIYTSADSGATWTARDSNKTWRYIASSSDGVKLAATVNNGQIYTSTDSGVTWTARDSNRFWEGITSSSDGAKLAAVVNNGQIYTSTDSGATWTARDSSRVWDAITSSSDGTKLAAVVGGTCCTGQIYTSTDSGVTWTARDANRNWTTIASSSDGVKLVAIVNNGQVYTSTDSGVTWTVRDSNRNWATVTSSSDGTKLAAGVWQGQIHTSTDSGATWQIRF